MRARPLVERLLEKLIPDPVTGCLNWAGAKNLKGYGRIKETRGPTRLPHRVAYEIARGTIPEGLVIDHLCRNPACCNPDHLEAVTLRENTRRGNSGLKDAIKTHCPQGHPYDEVNTRRTLSGNRYCAICKRDQTNATSRRRRAPKP